MEKYITPQAMVRPAEDIERITLALGVSNNASLITNPANADPDPAYRLDKASLAIQQTQQLCGGFGGRPTTFQLGPYHCGIDHHPIEKSHSRTQERYR